MILSLDLPFVKENPELMECLIKAHQKAAESNSNASSQLCQIATMGSGDFSKGVIAAIASVGGLHAPLFQARLVYRFATEETVKTHLAQGGRIPGFGNSFYKTSIDPSFGAVDTMLEDKFPEAWERIRQLHTWVVKVFPNAAMYTAAVCDLCGVPDGIEQALFITARTPVWAAQAVGE